MMPTLANWAAGSNFRPGLLENVVDDLDAVDEAGLGEIDDVVGFPAIGGDAGGFDFALFFAAFPGR